MTILKAIEILDLNIREAGPKMPADVLAALNLSREALKWRALMEKDYGSWCGPPLPGETT